MQLAFNKILLLLPGFHKVCVNMRIIIVKDIKKQQTVSFYNNIK